MVLVTEPQQSQPENKGAGDRIELTRPFYTVPEISFILGYTDDRTTRSKLKSGEIKGYKYRGMWRVLRQDLQDYINRTFGEQ